MGYDITEKGLIITLRKADINDAKLLWKWRNEKTARDSAFNPEYIPYDSHLKWLSNKLNDPKSFIYIALNDMNKTIGQIRFDKLDTNSAEVDVFVSEEYREKGYGSELIKLGCRKIFDSAKTNKILARVKKDNAASSKAFLNAGFNKIGDSFYKKYKIVEMELVKK